MALVGDVDRNVTITFIGRDNASRAMNSIGGSATQTTSKVGRLTAVLKTAARAAAYALAAAAVAGAYALYNLGKASLAAASDLQESTNAVRVAFGDASKDVLKLGRDAADAVGMSNAQFNQMAVGFSSFAETIAGRGGDVGRTVDDLSTRVADFASVMNLDMAEAIEKFQSGLAGETEPLRRYGIDVSAAAVETYALAKGITKAGETMTEQQKVQARYGLLMKETAKFAGDFKNTQKDAANAARTFSAKWQDALAKVGKALLPIKEDVLGWLIEVFVPWVESDFIPAFRKTIRWVRRNEDTFKDLWAASVDLWGALQDVGDALGDIYFWMKKLFGQDQGFWEDVAEGAFVVGNAATIASEGLEAVASKIALIVQNVRQAIDMLYEFASAIRSLPSMPSLPSWVPGLGNADGGYLRRKAFGGWTMVGEHGPELISNAGYVRTASQTNAMMAGGGGNTFVIQGAIDPVGTARQIRKILAKGDRASGTGQLGLA